MLAGGLNPPVVWTDDDHPPGVSLDLLAACYERAKHIRFGAGWYRVVELNVAADREHWRCELLAIHPAKSHR